MYSLSRGGVLVLNCDRPGSSFRQYGNSIGQDKKCDQQVIKIHDRMFSRWGSQGPDTELGRVGEISNMFDILSIHHDKPGNYI